MHCLISFEKKVPEMRYLGRDQYKYESKAEPGKPQEQSKVLA